MNKKKKYMKDTCPKCETFLVFNTYHRALDAGACWFCVKCNAHLTYNKQYICIFCENCAKGGAHIVKNYYKKQKRHSRWVR